MRNTTCNIPILNLYATLQPAVSPPGPSCVLLCSVSMEYRAWLVLGIIIIRDACVLEYMYLVAAICLLPTKVEEGLVRASELVEILGESGVGT